MSHSKIKADDEFGLTIQREGSERACLGCIGKPGENHIWKSERTSELAKCAANKNRETCVGRWLIKLLRMEHWRQVVFSRVEIWWNVGSKNGVIRRWQVCHRWWYGLWHCHRIEPFSKITIMREQGEWPIAKDIGPFFKRCNARHRQTFFNLVNVCLRHWKHLYSWERITQTIYIPKKKGGRSHFKADVRQIWKVDIGTFRWDFWSVSHQLGKFSMETIIFGQWRRSHQSLAYKGLCFLRFSVTSWKGESEHNSKFCLGRTVGLVQRFTTIQNFGHNWRRTDGIRVEYFPRIHHIAARRRSPKVHEQNERPSAIPWTNYLHVDVRWHHMGNERQWTARVANATFVSVFAKKIPAGCWLFLGPGSEKKWYSTYTERPRGEWDRVAELMMIKFRESGHPVFRATSLLSRGTLKSKGGGKLSIHFCADGDTIDTVFRTIISVNQLSIYGAVSYVCEEYSTFQTRTGRPVLAGHLGPLFEPAKLLIMTPRPSIEILHKKIHCKSTKNERKGFHNKIEW